MQDKRVEQRATRARTVQSLIESLDLTPPQQAELAQQCAPLVSGEMSFEEHRQWLLTRRA